MHAVWGGRGRRWLRESTMEWIMYLTSFILLRKADSFSSQIMKKRDDLHLIVSSATLDAEVGTDPETDCERKQIGSFYI